MLNQAQSRRIAKLDIHTPMLVPSFSSVVRPDVGTTHKTMERYLGRSSLVSAYDMSYGSIEADSVWSSDVIFLDSGNYESRRLAGTSRGRLWTLKMYREVLDHLGIPASSIIMVNFDEPISTDLQISRAKELFSAYDGYASDFLYKPESLSKSYVDIKPLEDRLRSLSDFDILGLTEKELGDSELSKCVNLLRIRKAMNNVDVELPIHLFGCLDPFLVIVYYICGADIFDGTAWLSESYLGSAANYLDLQNLLGEAESKASTGSIATKLATNLKLISRLQLRLQGFSKTHDYSAFALNTKASANLERLIDLAEKKV